ncbi:hypothetical protein [Thalassotalea sp. Y01]|uniref:hypothetical protein n=1 Tax=Thalassotalea sp. Y01 TaxID=2729613 RepID=UPI00145D3243|nr:hypothetical protein [Thalassotalea sp. Y01]NMP15069.1 hypothetical protein [Thalassotalea sp. Y01]
MKTSKKLSFIAMAMAPMLAFSTQAFDEQESAETVDPTACGIVSVYKRPPETKRLYHVVINTIDGVPVGSNSHSFVLSPGKHKIKVMENITDSYFTRRRGEMLNYKVIEIDVEANMRYYLGAKYNRKHKSKLKTGEYWDPVVWKTQEKECEV